MPAATDMPNARPLLLRLLLAVEGGVLDAAAAIRAAALFGISANSLRVALTRLSASGRIEAVGRGSYRLGHAARALGEDVATWRDAEQRLRPWHGEWIVACVAGLSRSDRRALRTRERAFALLGMRALDEALFIRPDNLAGGVARVRARLHALGVERSVPVFLAHDLDSASETRARALWQVRDLERGYRAGRKALETSLKRLPRLSLEQAARESYLVGDQALRRLVFDPLLPAPLISGDARQAFVEAMLRYDATGQRIWRELLALPG